MAKSVNLTAHRNTIEKRRKHAFAKDFAANVGNIIAENDVRCAAFIGIGADGRAFAWWDTGGLVPMYGFPETMGAVLKHSVEESNVQEDFKAPIGGGTFARKAGKK